MQVGGNGEGLKFIQVGAALDSMSRCVEHAILEANKMWYSIGSKRSGCIARNIPAKLQHLWCAMCEEFESQQPAFEVQGSGQTMLTGGQGWVKKGEANNGAADASATMFQELKHCPVKAQWNENIG